PRGSSCTLSLPDALPILLPAHQVAREREVRRGDQGEVWPGPRRRRPDGVRLQLGLPVEAGGREGEVVRRAEGDRGFVECRVRGADRKSTRLNSSHVKISY